MEQTITPKTGAPGRGKFFAGGFLIFSAIVYLIISATQQSAQYYVTVEELVAKGEDVFGRDVRVSGAVLGETIQYEAQSFTLTFTVAHVPGDNKEVEAQGGLAAVLHAAATDPDRARIQVVYHGVKPDLLRDEAQAIMTGQLGEDGVFYADELLLKCPTKYEELAPEQAAG
jgi:cytochrome c-type biogenesis protein CcmE